MSTTPGSLENGQGEFWVAQWNQPEKRLLKVNYRIDHGDLILCFSETPWPDNVTCMFPSEARGSLGRQRFMASVLAPNVFLLSKSMLKSCSWAELHATTQGPKVMSQGNGQIRFPTGGQISRRAFTACLSWDGGKSGTGFLTSRILKSSLACQSDTFVEAGRPGEGRGEWPRS